MLPKLAEGSLVLAEWLDSGRSDGWTRAEPDDIDALRCFSAGRLIRATKDAVTIAGHWTDDDSLQRAGSMTIPKRALLSLRALK